MLFNFDYWGLQEDDSDDYYEDNYKYFKMNASDKESAKRLPALFESVLKKDVKKTESLLKSGAHVDERFPPFFNATPLLVAVDCVNANIVEILLKFGADVNAVDMNGNSALLIALQRYHRDNCFLNREVYHIMNILFDNGCDVNWCNNDNDTPLSLACFSWDVDDGTLAYQLVDLGAKDETVDISGNTLLIRLLSSFKKTHAASFLMKKNISTHVRKTRDNNTLLHLAMAWPIYSGPSRSIYKAYKTIFRILKLGVDIDAVNNDKQQALHLALFKGILNRHLSQYLFDWYVNYNSMIEFATKYASEFQSCTIEIIWRNSAKQNAINQSAAHNRLCTLLQIKANDFPEQIYATFLEEVEKLKNTLITETSVTLYDFLRKDHNELVKLFRNDKVVHYLSKYYAVYVPFDLDQYYLEYISDCQINVHEFPVYRGNIHCRFQLGLIRKSLIDNCKRLSDHCSLKVLPSLCLELILFKLANSDLSTFIDAFERIML